MPPERRKLRTVCQPTVLRSKGFLEIRDNRPRTVASAQHGRGDRLCGARHNESTTYVFAEAIDHGLPMAEGALAVKRKARTKAFRFPGASSEIRPGTARRRERFSADRPGYACWSC